MSLEFAAMRWLKWEKRATLVLMERSPRYLTGEPDVLGILDNRYMLEVECKRSMADFRRNANKYHIANRTHEDPEVHAKFRRSAPRQFWFMVPPDLVEKVKPELPDYAGLMTVNEARYAKVEVAAPVNKDSAKLSIGECAKLMKCAGNQMVKLMEALSNHSRVSCSTDMDDFYEYLWDVKDFRRKPSGYLNFQI